MQGELLSGRFTLPLLMKGEYAGQSDERGWKGKTLEGGILELSMPVTAEQRASRSGLSLSPRNQDVTVSVSRTITMACDALPLAEGS